MIFKMSAKKIPKSVKKYIGRSALSRTGFKKYVIEKYYSLSVCASSISSASGS